MSDLRKEFWELILEIAKKDKDVIVLTGDLGYSFYEKFKLELPEQFINCGCAEQNMVGVAAGLARAGKKPYVYSNSIFLSSRAHEFIRDDIAYQNLNVKLIGTGANGFLGFTHNKNNRENNWLSGFPNMPICTPETKAILKYFLNTNTAIFINI